MIRIPLAAALLALAVPLLWAQEEEAEKVFRLANPSVVGLRNAEGSGTGILLDGNGLVLTNAHVVASPLPYRVQVDSQGAKGTTTVEFKSVQTVGVHPKYDLALVKFDPKEQPVKLVPAKLLKTKGAPGKRVYAIGNPAAGGVTLTKTITSGMLSAVDRVMEGLPYYQISAPVNPGNSGGPVCDKDGQVLGLVTFKLTEVEGIGFAIPLHDLKTDQFIPLQKKTGDAQKARELIQQADKFSDLAGQFARQFGLQDERRLKANAIACILYRMALAELPGNPDLYYNVGMLFRTLDENEVAAAYLVRCIQLRPWCEPNGNPYRELGFSLVKQKKRDQAQMAYTEGVAKHPATAGKIWEDLAIFNIENKEFAGAAWCAKAALRAGDCRANVMQSIHAESRGKLTAEEARSLDEREAALPETIKKMQEESDKARKDKKDHLTRPFAEFLKTFGDLPSDASPAPAKADPAPKTPDKPAEDAAASWIRSKLALAKNYHGTGLTDNAIKILDEVLQKYPDHPASEEAKKLKKEWRK